MTLRRSVDAITNDGRRVTHQLFSKRGVTIMQFFSNVVTTMSTVVTALGAGLAIWGGINLLEGYGADNPGAKSQGIKHFMPK